MKKALLFLSLVSTSVFGQDCAKIFISEYVEGVSNNKAVEIYNPTNQTINLSEYFIARYSNGSATASNQRSVQLSGTIAPYSVFVAVLDKRDPNGTGQEAPVWDSLQARADGFFSPVYATSEAFYFNGNDALLLGKGTLTSTLTDNVTTAAGFTVIDIFGKIGEDPGVAWTSTAPYNNGIGAELTKDHSLIRKASVLKGVTTPVASFNALAEYDSIPPLTYMFDANGDTIMSQAGNPIEFGNWNSLGSHDCGCNPLSVGSKQVDELTVYPNPSLDGVFYVKGATSVKEISVVNALGQSIRPTLSTNGATTTLKLNADNGVYIIRFVNENGSVTTKRVVIK